MDRLTAPWTDELVQALNRYQALGWMHPFTCPNRADDKHTEHPVLRATPSGWVCDACGYSQDWAWEFMAQPRPRLAI